MSPRKTIPIPPGYACYEITFEKHTRQTWTDFVIAKKLEHVHKLAGVKFDRNEFVRFADAWEDDIWDADDPRFCNLVQVTQKSAPSAEECLFVLEDSTGQLALVPNGAKALETIKEKQNEVETKKQS